MARKRATRKKVRKKQVKKKTSTKKTATRKKTTATKKKTTKRAVTKKRAKPAKKEEIEGVTEYEIVKEISKLLSVGIPEPQIVGIMKEAGLPDDEIEKLMNKAKMIYHPTAVRKRELEPEYYEPNPWLTIITAGVLLGIAIFAILVVLHSAKVI